MTQCGPWKGWCPGYKQGESDKSANPPHPATLRETEKEIRGISGSRWWPGERRPWIWHRRRFGDIFLERHSTSQMTPALASYTRNL